MAGWNGSGTFSRTHNWTDDKTNGIKITASRHDTNDTDFVNGINNCLTKDGQNSPTANLPMATYFHTGVGDGNARDTYPSIGQIQDSDVTWIDGGGTADAITATYSPAITALVDGMLLGVRATAANATTTPTFAPNGLTAYTIVKQGGSALAAGDIVGDGHELLLRYDLSNTRWELLNPKASFAVVDDTTPQLGGDLDMNGNQITSPDGTDLLDIPDGSIDLQTASTSRLDITDSGVRLGAANARVTTILDEDDMSSDSATALATQQSIKAYIDNNTSVSGVLQTITVNNTTEYTVSTAIPNDNSIPQSSEGVEIFSQAITPTDASSDIIIFGHISGYQTSAENMAVALFQDSNTNATAVCINGGAASGQDHGFDFCFIVPASSTTARTYKIRVGQGSGTIYVNRTGTSNIYGSGIVASTMILQEV